ncbi:hypothetical protein FIBSPDRAFT_952691 [Athelia psychrophila]|uniref:Uncharacterized protein n=1 Tax=Athelia psychrophila TaxID=1759441 RepID=A0A166L4P5_9AGAM|nr:hypothetical protein FIBSPDRAFT_952691 [Fibularhizoctonia sp. CBS 109695]
MSFASGTHKHQFSDSSSTTTSLLSFGLPPFLGYETNLATKMSPPCSRSTTPDITSPTYRDPIGYKIKYQVVCQTFSVNISQFVDLNFVATKVTMLPRTIHEHHDVAAIEIESECKKNYMDLLEFLLMQRQVEEADRSVAAAGKMKDEAEKNAEYLREQLQRLKITMEQGSYALNVRIHEEVVRQE